MTHIDPDVRISSTQALDILVEKVPEQVCRVGFAKTLSCFITLLGWQRLLETMQKSRNSGMISDIQAAMSNSGIMSTTTTLEKSQDANKNKSNHIKSLLMLLQAGLKGSESEEKSAKTVYYEEISDSESDLNSDDIIATRQPEKYYNPDNISFKFLVPHTSMPYLSLNLYEEDSGDVVFISEHKTSNHETDDEDLDERAVKLRSGKGSSEVRPTEKVFEASKAAITEDVDSRRLLVDYYRPVFMEGLKSSLKEGGELGRFSKQALELLTNLS